MKEIRNTSLNNLFLEDSLVDDQEESYVPEAMIRAFAESHLGDVLSPQATELESRYYELAICSQQMWRAPNTRTSIQSEMAQIQAWFKDNDIPFPTHLL